MSLTYSIRPVEQGDIHALAALHSAAWQASYREILPEAMLKEYAPERMADIWAGLVDRLAHSEIYAVFVAVQGQELLGFVGMGDQRDTVLSASYTGEITAIYVAQAAQRLGVGRALMAHAAEKLHAMGHRQTALWVLTENAKARRFYEAMGGVVVGERIEPHDDVLLSEVAYGWSDLPGSPRSKDDLGTV